MEKHEERYDATMTGPCNRLVDKCIPKRFCGFLSLHNALIILSVIGFIHAVVDLGVSFAEFGVHWLKKLYFCEAIILAATCIVAFLSTIARNAIGLGISSGMFAVLTVIALTKLVRHCFCFGGYPGKGDHDFGIEVSYDLYPQGHVYHVYWTCPIIVVYSVLGVVSVSVAGFVSFAFIWNIIYHPTEVETFISARGIVHSGNTSDVNKQSQQEKQEENQTEKV